MLSILSGGIGGLLADLFGPDQSKQIAAFTQPLASYHDFELASAAVGKAQLAASAGWMAGRQCRQGGRGRGRAARRHRSREANESHFP